MSFFTLAEVGDLTISARSGLDWLDAFEFPEFILGMRRPVEVDRELAVE